MIKYTFIAILFGFIYADHEFTCQWSDYITKFDGNGKGFLSGQYSYKANDNSTRMYKWKTCNINTVQETQIEYPKTWKNDPELILGCGGNTAISYIDINDDMYDIKCASLNNEYMLSECEWTGLLNDDNDILKYECRHNGLIRTIYTEYDYYKNDRKYRFECCNVENNVHNIVNMSCFEDRQFRNKHGKPVDYEARNVILSGIKSVNDIKDGDRIFKFKKCQPNDDNNYSDMIMSINNLKATIWEGTWESSCKDSNNGNSAIVGFKTEHDRYKRDNQFRFKCADLNQKKYGLINCGYTGYLNNWESDMDFSCPDDGVIRSIYSLFIDGFGDRRYRLECCQLVTNMLSEPKGEWVPLKPCFNCESNSYNYMTGLKSKMGRVSNLYISHVIDVIGTGYKYNGILTENVNNKVAVSPDMAMYTVNELSKDLNQAQMKEVSSFECDKDYVFQWRQSIKNALPNVGNHDVFVYSSALLCTDNIPQCPLGFCNEPDCTSCKEGYTFTNSDTDTERDTNPIPKYTNVNDNDSDTDVVSAVNVGNVGNTGTTGNDKISKAPVDTDLTANKDAPSNGIYFHGVNVTTLLIYTVAGVVSIILCCAVLIFIFKFCKHTNNKYKYDELRVINNLSDTTDVTTDVSDVNV